MSSNTTDIKLGTVLVVGGSGFVGGHCVRDVLQKGASKVHTLNSTTPEKDRKIAGVEYHAVDLGDAAGVKRVVQLAKPDVVIHTASPRPFCELDSVYDRVNIRGIQNILAACDSTGVTKAFVYTSSVSIIHDGVSDLVNADESWPILYAPEQKVRYWHTKAVAEKQVLEHNRTNNQEMLTTALRLMAIFGEDDEQSIGSLVTGAKTGRLKTQIGPDKNRLDWTYVGNVAAAHTLAAKRLLRAVDTPDPPERRVEGEAFIITNDDPRSFWSFARQVAEVAGYPVKPEEIRVLPAFMAVVIGFVAEWFVYITSFGRRRSFVSRPQMRFTVIDNTFNINKAKRQLGYRPEVSIDEGIRRSVASHLKKEQSETAKTK